MRSTPDVGCVTWSISESDPFRQQRYGPRSRVSGVPYVDPFLWHVLHLLFTLDRSDSTLGGLFWPQTRQRGGGSGVESTVVERPILYPWEAVLRVYIDWVLSLFDFVLQTSSTSTPGSYQGLVDPLHHLFVGVRTWRGWRTHTLPCLAGKRGRRFRMCFKKNFGYDLSLMFPFP